MRRDRAVDSVASTSRCRDIDQSMPGKCAVDSVALTSQCQDIDQSMPGDRAVDFSGFSG